MTLNKIVPVAPAGGPAGELSRPQAADLLQLSPRTVDVLLRSGYLPDLAVGRVLGLSRARFLTVDGGEQPVLRQAPAQPSPDPVERPYLGDSAWLTDEQVLEADRKWWRCDAPLLVEVELLPVQIGGFVVGVLELLEVDGELREVLEPDPARGKSRPVTHVRYSFQARLAGRVRALGEPERDLVAKHLTDEQTAFVRTVLGARSAARSGGPIAYLPST